MQAVRAVAVALAATLAAGGLLALPTAQAEEAELELVWSYTSKAMHHQRFLQVLDGYPVHEASLSTHSTVSGPSWTYIDDDLETDTRRSGSLVLDEAAAVAIAQAATGAGPLLEGPEPEVRWVRVDDVLRLAYVVDLTPVAIGLPRVIVDAEDGRVHEIVDMAFYADRDARVFRDNPIVALQDPDLQDNPLNVDDGTFAGAYMDVTLEGLEDRGFANHRLIIADALADAAIDESFVFDRADPRFLEANAFFYIDHAMAELERLGYGGLVEERINVRSHMAPVVTWIPFVASPDAYAGNGWITFFYRALSQYADGPERTHVGTGSSAEDAEIAVHELGHIIHGAANPDVERPWGWVWGEGNGDILAAFILEEFTEGYGDPCVFEWLGAYYTTHFLFEYEDLLCLRVLDNQLQWEEDHWEPIERYSTSHENGQFWAGPIWEVRQEIGRDEALTLWMESLFLVPAEPEGIHTFGESFLRADLAVNGGANEQLIRDAFSTKGILLDENLTAASLPAEDAPTAQGSAEADGAGESGTDAPGQDADEPDEADDEAAPAPMAWVAPLLALGAGAAMRRRA